jgi:hypothetical protein
VTIVQWELRPVVASDGIARLLHSLCPNVMVKQSVERRRVVLCRVGDAPLEVVSAWNGCEDVILEHLQFLLALFLES